MSFDWKEFLNLACFLRGEKVEYSRESALRSAVSRAYYSVFCYIRNYARDKEGFKPQGNSKDHKNLREYFKKNGRGRLASLLNELRLWRNICDYEDKTENLEELTINAIDTARDILNTFL